MRRVFAPLFIGLVAAIPVQANDLERPPALDVDIVSSTTARNDAVAAPPTTAFDGALLPGFAQPQLRSREPLATDDSFARGPRKRPDSTRLGVPDLPLNYMNNLLQLRY